MLPCTLVRASSTHQHWLAVDPGVDQDVADTNILGDTIVRAFVESADAKEHQDCGVDVDTIVLNLAIEACAINLVVDLPSGYDANAPDHRC